MQATQLVIRFGFWLVAEGGAAGLGNDVVCIGSTGRYVVVQVVIH